MESAATGNIRTASRSRAWTHAIAVTASLVALIQICLFATSLLVPKGSSPRSVAVSEVTAIALAELVVALALLRFLRNEGRSFRKLGLWDPATIVSWILGIGLGLLTAFWGLSNPAFHFPSKFAALFDPSPWHIYTALVAGIAAGFCEEIIFRGFVMQELSAARSAAWVQVVGSALLFGAAHAGLLRAGIKAGLLIIIPTAFLGVLYSLIYLAGRRSLMPVIVSHFLNDFAVIPWVLFIAASRHLH